MPRRHDQQQLELSLHVLPVPEAGTVAIIRIEDWLALDRAVRERQAREMRTRSKAAQVPEELRLQVATWLAGRAPSESYPADLPRSSLGGIASASVDEILAGCPRVLERYGANHARLIVGAIAADLGWRKRYPGGKPRRYRYFPPEPAA